MTSFSFTSRGREAGMTLVELMVGLAIGLVVSLIAGTAYIGSKQASQALDAQSRVNEYGRLVLRQLANDIQNSGFYPGDQRTDSTAGPVLGRFTNVVAPLFPPVFSTGLFGCDGATFNPTTDACNASTAGAPDSIVINFFSSDRFAAGAFMGHMRDCLRQNVFGTAAAPAYNQTRAALNLPVLISNRYGLSATTYDDAEGRTVNTFSLACSGNGNSTLAGVQPIYQGVEDMVIRYAAYDPFALQIAAGASQVSQSAPRYYTAAEISALPVEIDDKTGLAVSPWDRVTAVRLCVVIRSTSNGRESADVTGTTSYQNCRGGVTNYPAGDRTVYRRFEQSVAVRNALSGI